MSDEPKDEKIPEKDKDDDDGFKIVDEKMLADRERINVLQQAADEVNKEADQKGIPIRMEIVSFQLRLSSGEIPRFEALCALNKGSMKGPMREMMEMMAPTYSKALHATNDVIGTYMMLHYVLEHMDARPTRHLHDLIMKAGESLVDVFREFDAINKGSGGGKDDSEAPRS